MSNTTDLNQPETRPTAAPLEPLVGRPACDRRSFVLACCSGLVAAASGAFRSAWVDDIRPLPDGQINWRALRQDIVRERVRLQELHPGEELTCLKGTVLSFDDHRYALLVRSQVRSCFEIARRTS